MFFFNKPLDIRSMVLRGTGRIFRSGEAKTLYISIPSSVVTDSTFPFEEDQTVTIRIENGELTVEPTEDQTNSKMERDDCSRC